MKRMFTKKFWTILISIFTFAISIVIACSDGWWPEYGASNFTPEAFVEKKYSPFFYSNQFYYGIGHDDGHSTRFNESNLDDWFGYFDNEMPAEEVDYLLNKAGKGCVDSIQAYILGKITSLPAGVHGFKLFKDRSNKKTTGFINYLALAKEAEIFANNVADSWDYESRKTARYDGSAALNASLLKNFTATEDKFLKQRYWFQLVRSYFFNDAPQKAAGFFELHEKEFEKNKIFLRSQAYAAGAYYRLKDYGKANYYYSLVYDACDELKTVAHYSFHPQEEHDWQITLSLCKNKQEKITLWQMLGIFYSDEKRSIREIYRLDPLNKKLNLLLARAVNKEEQKMNLEYNGFDPGKLVGIKIDKDLNSLVTNIAGSSKTGNKFMWSSAAGYLRMLSGNFKQADMLFSEAQKTIANNELQRWQLRLLKVLNKIMSPARIDDRFEKEILGDVEWLYSFKNEEANAFRYADAFAFIKYAMAKKYRRQQELVKAACFVSQPVFYRNNRNVEAMKLFLQKNNKSAYEQLCEKLYPVRLDDLYEYQAIRLTFEDKIAEAITFMEKAGERGNSVLAGNPFNGRIRDCHECDHEAYRGTAFSKLSLLKKMKDMRENVESGRDVYNNALLLGNAYYNLTHYGNARLFYESAITGSGHYSPFAIDTVFKGFLISMKQASAYYKKAMAVAVNKEQQAKCCFMLAKCERNEWYNRKVYNATENDYSDDHMVDLKAISNFKILRQYAGTRYYEEVIKECGYFRTFVK